MLDSSRRRPSPVPELWVRAGRAVDGCGLFPDRVPGRVDGGVDSELVCRAGRRHADVAQAQCSRLRPIGAVRLAALSDGSGYWEAEANGTVAAFGKAPSEGAVTTALNGPIVGMASTPDGGGYLDGRVGRWRLQLRRCALLRFDGFVATEPDDRRPGLDTGRQGLLARGGRRRHLQGDGDAVFRGSMGKAAQRPDGGYGLRRGHGGLLGGCRGREASSASTLPSWAVRAPSASTSRSWGWRGPRMGSGIASWPLTAASSATARRPSKVRPAVSPWWHRWWLWHRTTSPVAIGWRRPTAASSTTGGAAILGRANSTLAP